MSATPGTATPAKGAAVHDHWVGALFIGFLLLFFALWGVTVQLTTSEAWFLGNTLTGTIVAPHFGVLGQPLDFFNGHMTGLRMEAFTYAWGVEIIQFLFSTGLIFSTMSHNRVVSWICIGGGLLIMLLDSIADYLFNQAANGWQQAGFSLITFMMAFGLSYYALHLILVKGVIAPIQRRLKHP